MAGIHLDDVTRRYQGSDTIAVDTLNLDIAHARRSAERNPSIVAHCHFSVSRCV
ncbi:hypothetical protein [Hoyosella subflava]|uniref:Uncharacterized protein n=1 Tax=Hoyosella subflava (strain DSM 45089 / JCM 17490 / NBRC 109087 / DQS3-9A1) TaxID=443218 RepID=F6EQ61_HOYSD|nr:hypothetical protein [Hoyosella subflava]AEF39484.1 hypothetical protein AS9A_1032 [Hoyosella subflava DQS3-9A1]